MKKEEYENLWRLENSPYNFAKRELLAFFLKKFLRKKKGKILDVGCGLGGMMAFLEKKGFSVQGIDCEADLVAACQKKGLKVKKGRAENLPFPPEEFMAIIAMEVQEHLPSPFLALREYARVLKPGGLLLLTVPAFSFLWNRLDETAGHKRRYTLSQLEKETAPLFFPLKVSYLFFFPFFPVLAWRIFRRLFREKDGRLLRDEILIKPKILEKMFLILFRGENFLLRFFSFPLGLGVIGVFKKKN